MPEQTAQGRSLKPQKKPEPVNADQAWSSC